MAIMIASTASMGFLMDLQIRIPEPLEAALKWHADAAGQNLETFVLAAVEITLAGLQSLSAIRRPPRERWFAELKMWADGHPPVNHFADDSRERIYSDD